MPDWLVGSLTLDSNFSAAQLAVRLAMAALYGACVAGIYRLSHGRDKQHSAPLVATLVLLSILIAMVSLVIGDSVARAFSLVGALSIVRFRTVVEDTRDTAFVIFAVVVGMAAGAGLLFVPLVGMPMVGGAALLLSLRQGQPQGTGSADSSLAIRMGLARDPEELLGGVLRRHLAEYRLKAVETAKQGSALDLNYVVRMQPTTSLAALVAELNQIEGVHGVELRA